MGWYATVCWRWSPWLNRHNDEGAEMRGQKEPVQLICPECRYQVIVYLPLDDDLPMCPQCRDVQMIIEELLDEGKSY